MSGRGAEFATLSDHLEEESVGRQWAGSFWVATDSHCFCARQHSRRPGVIDPGSEGGQFNRV